MKRCPKCHEVYADDTIFFCRKDGALLKPESQSSPSNATLKVPSSGLQPSPTSSSFSRDKVNDPSSQLSGTPPSDEEITEVSDLPPTASGIILSSTGSISHDFPEGDHQQITSVNPPRDLLLGSDKSTVKMNFDSVLQNDPSIKGQMTPEDGAE